MEARAAGVMARDVYVIGAGFSAGLGFPLTTELLPFALSAMDDAPRDQLTKILKFHFPAFEESNYETYPNIEDLLTRIQVNKTLFHASRSLEGRFKERHLDEASTNLLYTITASFHKMLRSAEEQDWLVQFVAQIKSTNAAIICFNWDLVLDVALTKNEISGELYTESPEIRNQPILLKPHGSLNWYLSEFGQHISVDKREILWGEAEVGETNVAWPAAYLFPFAREPKSEVGRRYVPWIVPPTYVKSFDHPFLQQTWRTCVSCLSQAKNVYFLGYSMPEYDFHSEFIFRCGFHNQREGMLRPKGRAKPTNAARVVVVNPSKVATTRISSVLGVASEYFPMTVATWVRSQHP
jgi:hypothetical protein